MTRRVHLSRWKSPQAEQRFRELEDELIRELVAEPPTPIDVTTRLGPTRVYRWGGHGEPFVFLHGSGGTSLMWAPYAEHRQNRTMYAVDTIGDVGRSHQDVAVERADDLAEWLDETLTQLHLERVHLAGASYGGFVALNLAARRPARVRSLCLIEPGGIVRVRLLRFLLWGIPVLFASWLPTPLRRVAARILRFPWLEHPRILRLALHGQLNHRSRLFPAEPLTDDQLRSINQPALLIIGEKSEVFSSREVRARAEALLPRAEIEVVSGAGHAAAASHADALAQRIVAFVQSQDTSGTP
jgi:pimeloyl-ACP methyl ester carboxylesterase